MSAGSGDSPPAIDDLLIEILRAGPAHNQLLSPLTPYLALCGADGPVGLQLPFEHAQLLTRLNRLRYQADGAAVPDVEREAEVAELGATIARLLGQVPALVGGLEAARAAAGRLVNLRLRISAFELGLVPFEVTLAPADAAGLQTQPLLLQRPMVGITREIRRSRALPVDWDRAPRILFAFASPADLPPVPAREHVDALRRAIDPWVGIRASAAARLVDVRRLLTVLKNASTRTIAAACRSGDYTHVHLLAHGAPLPGSDGQRRFGICLAADDEAGADDGLSNDGRRTEDGRWGSDGRASHVVVDGQRLALALAGVGGDGHRSMPPPTVVTLATCDGGNVGSVLAPGGSIAHELHAQDIPWVVASQFPLGMRASTLLTETLYAGLLAGDDPRWVLHRVRQRLRLALPHTHDWASLVAYASIAPDLEAQVDAFRSRQTKARLDVRFARMDDLVASRAAAAGGGPGPATDLAGNRPIGPTATHASGPPIDPTAHHAIDSPADPTADQATDSPIDPTTDQATAPPINPADDRPAGRPIHPAANRAADRPPGAEGAELARLGQQVRAELAAWCDEPIARRDRRQRAARLTMRAASEKRIAILYGAWAADDPAARPLSEEAYRLARRHYRAACKAEPASHWAITQFLSLLATPALSPTAAELATTAGRHRRWWQAAWQLAEWDAASADGGRAIAWAHGSLAELELLGAVYADDERTPAARREAVVTECRRLCEACDEDAGEDRFPVASTLRQFRRYLDHWPRPEWADLAEAAVRALESGA